MRLQVAEELAFFRERAQLPPESRGLLGEEEFLAALFLVGVVRGLPEGCGLLEQFDDGCSVGGVDAGVGEQSVDACFTEEGLEAGLDALVCFLCCFEVVLGTAEGPCGLGQLLLERGLVFRYRAEEVGDRGLEGLGDVALVLAVEQGSLGGDFVLVLEAEQDSMPEVGAERGE